MTGSDPSSAAIDISADTSAANSRIKIPSQDFNKHPTCPPEKGRIWIFGTMWQQSPYYTLPWVLKSFATPTPVKDLFQHLATSNDLNRLTEDGLETQRRMYFVRFAKDKLEGMDISLMKEGVRVVAIIFRTCLQPNCWTYITSLGTKWKIWILSFQRYLIIHCRSNGLVMALVQSWVVFDVFQKMAINPKR